MDADLFICIKCEILYYNIFFLFPYFQLLRVAVSIFHEKEEEKKIAADSKFMIINKAP